MLVSLAGRVLGCGLSRPAAQAQGMVERDPPGRIHRNIKLENLVVVGGDGGGEGHPPPSGGGGGGACNGGDRGAGGSETGGNGKDRPDTPAANGGKGATPKSGKHKSKEKKKESHHHSTSSGPAVKLPEVVFRELDQDKPDAPPRPSSYYRSVSRLASVFPDLTCLLRSEEHTSELQ